MVSGLVMGGGGAGRGHKCIGASSSVGYICIKMSLPLHYVVFNVFFFYGFPQIVKTAWG